LVVAVGIVESLQGGCRILPIGERESSSLDRIIQEPQSMVRKQPGYVITVVTTLIDKLVRELDLGRVDYIKMDIEGAERKALLGARETH
jgi:FkbM family methyltransferase